MMRVRDESFMFRRPRMGHSGLLSSRSPPPPAKVEFIVPGSAPDGIQVPYGPGGTRLSGPPVPGGTAAMTISFDASAAYYALNAHLQGDGDIACKTVATGPATGRDDHRRSNHLCAGPGRQEAAPWLAIMPCQRSRRPEPAVRSALSRRRRAGSDLVSPGCSRQREDQD